MTDELAKKIGRLALREEGSMWNAYYALPDSMEGAIFIGSIAMRFVSGPDNEPRRAIFMTLMRDAVSDMMEELFGTRPTWPEGPVTAPEHERGGNA